MGKQNVITRNRQNGDNWTDTGGFKYKRLLPQLEVSLRLKGKYNLLHTQLVHRFL